MHFPCRGALGKLFVVGDTAHNVHYVKSTSHSTPLSRTRRTSALLTLQTCALRGPWRNLCCRSCLCNAAASARLLIAALRSGALGGTYVDVFAHEPLPADSPLWALPNLIVTPHSAGFSDGNEARVARMFLDNLGRWARGEPLAKLADGAVT